MPTKSSVDLVSLCAAAQLGARLDVRHVRFILKIQAFYYKSLGRGHSGKAIRRRVRAGPAVVQLQ